MNKFFRVMMLTALILVSFVSVALASKAQANKNLSLYEATIKEMFGGIGVDNLVSKLGAPIKKVEKSDYTRWYFKQGIEIDVVKQNDSFYMLFNYIYISPKSKIKIPRNVGVGSSKTDVLVSYKNEIDKELSKNDNIVLGANEIIFVIKNDRVESIFISTGAFTKDEGK